MQMDFALNVTLVFSSELENAKLSTYFAELQTYKQEFAFPAIQDTASSMDNVESQH
jgi:hypothetical protein